MTVLHELQEAKVLIHPSELLLEMHRATPAMVAALTLFKMTHFNVHRGENYGMNT